MSKHRANRGPMSRLPEGEAYWETLTDRVVTNATSRLSEYRNAGRRWWHRLARISTPLIAAAAAAVIAALLWSPKVGDEPGPGASPAILYGFGLNDPLAASFITSTAAPTMATLMATPTSERTP